ncbi:MAG: hypothetical protein F4087_00385 [Gemmatimonadetes bacterium]|nr:hypothetical protein [Gemmatimonadota bacterium]MXX33567.1 hypothetical protein [Gemmatimonadota bacterium]MYA11220.1 hypothetical protein [Gemmatimonadota bacterium]MYD14897.1 hypothetical protein [Gemmatimonadota bacterium]MYE70778.1 hypothetical protein [Gemmatimonadota bacterium]
MRAKSRIIGSLETVYTEAYEKAAGTDDRSRMEALDFGFQRDQIMLEVMLDLRDALATLQEEAAPDEPSLLDRAKAIRDLARLRPR